MIKKDDTITIEKVGNGFVIRPECRQHEMVSNHNMIVFNTLTQLTKFVKAHFAEKEEVL